MQYDWNGNKRASNITKHGIDFVDVHEAIEGPDAATTKDPGEYGEERFLTFGWLRGHVIVVAHTEHDGIIRIISARKASRHEQRLYFRYLQQD